MTTEVSGVVKDTSGAFVAWDVYALDSTGNQIAATTSSAVDGTYSMIVGFSQLICTVVCVPALTTVQAMAFNDVESSP